MSDYSHAAPVDFPSPALSQGCSATINSSLYSCNVVFTVAGIRKCFGWWPVCLWSV